MCRKILIVFSIVSILVFNSPVRGGTVSTLLEEGIYAEETKGDLDEAITIYRKIIDTNTDNAANVAEAYYRLGTCYLKKDDEAKAIKMLKALLAGFRDHEEIASKARAQLVKLKAFDEEGPTNQPFEFGPVPWESGEVCWYDIKTPTGAVAGKMILSIKEVIVEGNEMWRIESYTVHPVADSQTFDRADILKENFTPVSSIIKANSETTHTEMRVAYEKGNIRFIPDSRNPEDKKDIPVDGTVISNNGQQYYILRLLPIKKNYNTSSNIFVARRGRVMNMQIKTTSRETVTVPSGTFDSYRIELEFDPNLKSQIWVSDDDKKNIVKIEAPGITMELEKVTRETSDEPREFSDRKTGISLSAPKGWHFVKSDLLTPALYKITLLIVAPEVKAAPGLVIVPSGGLKSVHDIVGLTIEPLKKLFKNFTIRPESWVYGEIDGLPSLTYLADYDGEDRKMVEYRTYILSPQELATFVLRTDKEVFYEIKTDVDSIVQSFKWEKKAFSF